MSGKPPCLRASRGSAFDTLPWGLGLLVVGLGLASLPRESRSQVAPPRPGGTTASAPGLCEGRHGAGGGVGESGSLDLGAIRRAYAALATGLARKLDRAAALPAGPITVPERPPEAGLPACRGSALRHERLPGEAGARLRGRMLFFAQLGRPEDFELPAEVLREPGALLFVLGARSLKDLRGLEERLGRPVTLAKSDFARMLGVRCVNTLLTVSENGDAVTIHENP